MTTKYVDALIRIEGDRVEGLTDEEIRGILFIWAHDRFLARTPNGSELTVIVPRDARISDDRPSGS